MSDSMIQELVAAIDKYEIAGSDDVARQYNAYLAHRE